MQFLGMLIAFFVLIGCASNADRAKEHMEKENWEKAHEYWMKALKDNPNDEEIIEGKRAAEFEITNKKLIQLRGLIQVGKAQRAVDLAWELNKLHMKWGHSSGHNISSFHDKQIVRLYPLFIRLLKTQNFQKHPLKQYILISRFEPVFAKRNLNKISEVKKSVIAKGKAQCAKLRRGVTTRRAFHADMVSRVCHVFDHSNEVQKTEDRKNPFLISLAKDASYNVTVRGLSKSYHDHLRAEMMKTAEDTPFFHSVGTKNISFQITGGISRKTRSQWAYRQADYTVTEEYTDYEEVYVDGRKEKKEVKKKRNRTKTYTYRVTESIRTYQYNLKASFKLGGRKRFITLTDKESQTIVNHNNTFRQAGVSPKSESFESKTFVINRILEKFSKKSQDQLESLWDRMYCKGDLPGGFVLATERMMKCRMLAKSKSSKYLVWMETFFGISKEDDRSDFEKFMGLDQEKKG